LNNLRKNQYKTKQTKTKTPQVQTYYDKEEYGLALPQSQRDWVNHSKQTNCVCIIYYSSY